MNEFNFQKQEVIERGLDDAASRVEEKIDDFSRIADFDESKINSLKELFDVQYQLLKEEIAVSILSEDISLDLGIERVFNLFYEIIEGDVSLILSQRLGDFAVADDATLQNRSVLAALLQDVYNQLDEVVLVFDQMISKIDDLQILTSLLLASEVNFARDFVAYYMNADTIYYERKTEFLMALHRSEIDRAVVDFAFEKLLLKSNPHFGSFVGLRPDGSIAQIALDNGSYRDVKGNPVSPSGNNYYQILSDLGNRGYLNAISEPLKSFFLTILDERRQDNARSSVEIRRSEDDLIMEVGNDLQGLYKFDRVSGQGGVMQHLLAFQRAAREIRTDQESLEIVYPGSGPHLATLELINGLFENNSNLNSVNLIMTEYKNYMPVILNYLPQFQKQGLISDLQEGWNRIYENEEYRVYNTSEIVFKIRGKLVKITYNFRTHGRGGFWAGQENLDRSDLVIIHDLDTSEPKQFKAVLDSVRATGNSKRVLIATEYIQDIESLRSDYPELNIAVDYKNPHENFGCVCTGLACQGMAVLTISRNNIVE